MSSRRKVRPTPPPLGPALVKPAVGVLLLTLGGAAGCAGKAQPPMANPGDPPMIEEAEPPVAEPPMVEEADPPMDDPGDPPMIEEAEPPADAPMPAPRE